MTAVKRDVLVSNIYGVFWDANIKTTDSSNVQYVFLQTRQVLKYIYHLRVIFPLPCCEQLG